MATPLDQISSEAPDWAQQELTNSEIQNLLKENWIPYWIEEILEIADIYDISLENQKLAQIHIDIQLREPQFSKDIREFFWYIWKVKSWKWKEVPPKLFRESLKKNAWILRIMGMIKSIWENFLVDTVISNAQTPTDEEKKRLKPELKAILKRNRIHTDALFKSNNIATIIEKLEPFIVFIWYTDISNTWLDQDKDVTLFEAQQALITVRNHPALKAIIDDILQAHSKWETKTIEQVIERKIREKLAPKIEEWKFDVNYIPLVMDKGIQEAVGWIIMNSQILEQLTDIWYSLAEIELEGERKTLSNDDFEKLSNKILWISKPLIDALEKFFTSRPDLWMHFKNTFLTTKDGRYNGIKLVLWENITPHDFFSQIVWNKEVLTVLLKWLYDRLFKMSLFWFRDSWAIKRELREAWIQSKRRYILAILYAIKWDKAETIKQKLKAAELTLIDLKKWDVTLEQLKDIFESINDK